ncbi:uncharacterized protein VITFI_CDS0236 [Vitreoscilla filiformis]|uniref:Uncharacterized protein n=1 Tax=Vitreoscilla filiformis TaxID=63 RepID=A0A221KAM3_VITFI|nr:FG-GAP-like repeat-containing protein [Vitreoscilla filiformis]ASM76015.1 uncharacterized protein VITFI_CDS0236 [Vitreoscilla filiformis]
MGITVYGTAGNNTLQGSTGNDSLIGLAGHDLLNGNVGADTLIGGFGNDTYVVDSTADRLTERLNQGTDLVRSTVSWQLGSNFENLALWGTANIKGIGNNAKNIIYGNSGANELNGNGGIDTLFGGLGNDTYVVDTSADRVIEKRNAGIDLVLSSQSFTLTNYVENLTLTGTKAIKGSGNSANNVLTGNAAANQLNGNGGQDTLIGGLGNDTYVVDSLSDVVTEAGGTDLIQASVSYTLAANGVENLTLTGISALNGTGNTSANVITGNTAANRLDGGAGSDTLIGGTGNDTYVVDSLSDVVTEAGGTDLIQASVSYTLATNGVENLTLTGVTDLNGTGNASANVITGNTGANRLEGGAGNDSLSGAAGTDTLIGGAGNDTYSVDSTSDIVTEVAGEGVDLIQASVSYTLTANGVENLTLTGTSALNGTGNTSANVITGNAGANTLASGGGVDTLVGAAGADVFTLVDSDLTALTTSSGAAMSIDGGADWDTLTLATTTATLLDLVAITDATGSGTARLQNIQTVNLGASGAQQLALQAQDVVSLASSNVLNSGNASSLGWSNGSYSLSASESRYQLVIEGSAQDEVLKSTLDSSSNGEWAFVGTLNQGGTTYDVYNDVGGTAQIIVNAAVQFNSGLVHITPATVTLSALEATSGGFVIRGLSAGEKNGWSVSSAGDVNGDGLADLIVGAPASDPSGGDGAGRSYVVFGKTNSTAVNVSTLTSGTNSEGFVINGQALSSAAGWSVSDAGDVNGDGLADVIVGSPGGAPSFSRIGAGRSYVVFGTTASSALDLSVLTAGSSTQGFVINGQTTGDLSGYSVSSAGDVNGDGLDDLIVGAYQSDPNGQSGAGRSYVVFGKTGGSVVEVSSLTAGTSTTGFVINGEAADDKSGFSVSAAGDVNGDGLADLIIGGHSTDATGADAGRSYVVFGKTDGSVVNASDLATGNSTAGFVIDGASSSELSGWAVSDAGDVNGDGLADLIVSASCDPVNSTQTGRSYVVFGKTGGAIVELSDLTAGTGSGGFVIRGETTGDWTGYAVSSAGDVNGDGLDDLIVGAHGADAEAGTSYVVYGKTGGAVVELSSLTSGMSSAGFVISGGASADWSGYSVSTAGDVNGDGDGFDDLIVSSPYADTSAGSDAGVSYIVFGGADAMTQWVFDSRDGDAIGTSSAESLTGTSGNNQIVAGAGDDTLTGAGGADVLYGGAGNDVIVLNASNVTALGQTGGSQAVMRVDGGTGIDTLRIDGAGITLNLTPLKTPVIQNIDIVDLTGSGNNVLTLSVLDVLQLGAANTFSTAGRQQLMVSGDAGDSVTLSDSGNWSVAGSLSYGGQSYTLYNHNSSAAQLLIDTDLLP